MNTQSILTSDICDQIWEAIERRLQVHDSMHRFIYYDCTRNVYQSVETVLMQTGQAHPADRHLRNALREYDF